jgi:hypothetical protein
MQGPLTDAEIVAIDLSTSEICGRFAIKHSDAHSFLEGLDLWALQQLSTLNPNELQAIVVAVTKMFVRTANGIYTIIAEEGSNDNPYDQLPPVLPHQLVKLNLRDFNNLMSQHLFRLEKRFSSSQIHQIGKEFVDLLRAHREERVFRENVDACDDNRSFSGGWRVAGSRFILLRQFCGDLASTFPNTAPVESDFSVIGWEKDE